VVVLGYCCGFLVKEGFAWVGGIAVVGRQRVKIGDKGPLDWIGLDWGERGEDSIPWERQHDDRPNEIGPRPPACERVSRCGADSTRRNVVESRESRVLAFGSLSSAWTAD
jgi:hypothetical protein